MLNGEMGIKLDSNEEVKSISIANQSPAFPLEARVATHGGWRGNRLI